MTLICTCLINWRRKNEDKAEYCKRFLFRVDSSARARLLHVTFGIPPVCRPIMELKPSTDHKVNCSEDMDHPRVNPDDPHRDITALSSSMSIFDEQSSTIVKRKPQRPWRLASAASLSPFLVRDDASSCRRNHVSKTLRLYSPLRGTVSAPLSSSHRVFKEVSWHTAKHQDFNLDEFMHLAIADPFSVWPGWKRGV